MSLTPPLPKPAVAVNTMIPKFTGSVCDIDAQSWLEDFEIFCLDRGIDEHPNQKLKYFKALMTESARDWLNKLSSSVKTEFEALQAAFLLQYGDARKVRDTPATRYQDFQDAVKTSKTIDDLRDVKEWRMWLSMVLDLATKVDTSFVSEEYMTIQFWTALPEGLLSHLGTMPKSISAAVNLCRALPSSVYEKVVASHDELAKVNTRLEDIAVILNHLRRRGSLPPTPPEEKRPRFETISPTPSPPSKGNFLRLMPPPAQSVDVTAIPQLMFPDTDQGHRDYQEALKKYRLEHPRVHLQPPLTFAYPLYPGTEHPGTGECHRCGKKGHQYWFCKDSNERALDQAEQNYRRMFSQAVTQQRGQGNHVQPTPYVRQEHSLLPRASSHKGAPSLSGAGTTVGAMPPSLVEGRDSLLLGLSSECTLADAVEGTNTSPHKFAPLAKKKDDALVSHIQSLMQDDAPVSHIQSLMQIDAPVSHIPPVSCSLPTTPSVPPSPALRNGPGDSFGLGLAMSSLSDDRPSPSIGESPLSTTLPTTNPLRSISLGSQVPVETTSPTTPPPSPSISSPSSVVTPPLPESFVPPPPRRRSSPRPKVDLRALQHKAQASKNRLFTVAVHFTAASNSGDDFACIAAVDEGAMVNTISQSMVGAAGLQPSPSDIYLRMASGQVVQSLGVVKLLTTVQDIDGDKTDPVEIEYEVMPGTTTTMLLGRPWKVKVGALHFYELDLLFVPQYNSGSLFRRWARIIPTHQPANPHLVPDTPMTAVKLLIAAQPYASVAQLEALSYSDTVLDLSSLTLNDDLQEETEVTDDALDITPFDELVDADYKPTLSVRFELPVDEQELQDLQHRLPVTNDDPDYLASRARTHSRFRPYRVNGKLDDDSDERSERVLKNLLTRFGSVGSAAQRQHLAALLRAKHLAFAETTAECKQNMEVICDPILTSEPPPTKRRSKTQALSPPQKDFLHSKVRELLDNGFMVKIPENEVRWISETRIVPKPAAEIDSNVSLEELKLQANAALREAGLEHDESLPPPSIVKSPPTVEVAEGRYRLVHNYAPINHYMKDNSFIPGDIEVKASKFSGKQYLFKGDGCAGFFIMANSRLATLLSVTYVEDFGFVGYTVMPFGFKVGPSLYYRFITTAFGDLFDRDSDFWMDDVASGHQDFDSYFCWLRAFLDRAIDTGFTLSVQKCRFLHENITFCGQLIGLDGIRADPSRLKAILNWPTPKTVRELMTFRGVCSYLRSKVPDFAKVFAPLDSLTAGIVDYDDKLIDAWTPAHDAAFLRIKNALVNSRVLKEPRWDRPFIVHSDWSAEGIGAVLLQQYVMQKDANGRWNLLDEPEIDVDKVPGITLKKVVFPISYASKKCTEAESRYSAHLGELVAAKFALTRFSAFTFGQPVILVTDCIALRDILRNDKMPVAHARWREQLLAHNIIRVEHCAGRRHQLAHGLSHRPSAPDDDKPLAPVLPDDRELLALAAFCPVYNACLDQPASADLFVAPIAYEPPPSLQDVVERYLVIDKEAGPLLEQFKGDELEPILRFLLLLEMPSTQALRDKLQRLKRYWLVDSKLVYEQDGLLLDVLPRSQGIHKLARVHQLGHAGINMLVKKLRLQEMVTWPKLYADAKEVLKTCQACQLYGPRCRSQVDPIIVAAPMETWAMDFVSLPTSHGKSKLLVIVDYFSRYLWTFPLAQARGVDVVASLKSLHDNLSTLPSTIITDGGSHFDCAEVYDFLTEHGVDQHITPAYAPWVNGLVERNNGLILQTLRRLCAAAAVDAVSSLTFPWTEQLSTATRELNRRPIADLSNLSPTELLFGFVMADRTHAASATPELADVQMQRAFIDVRQVEALSTLEAAQAIRSDKSKPRSSGADINPGDLVLRHQTLYESTYSTRAKLAPKWVGPFMVMSKKRKTYTIKSLVDGKEERVHLDCLKRYYPSTTLLLEMSNDGESVPVHITRTVTEDIQAALAGEDELRD
ncbi:uncharacterized protein UTRI_00416 [Ustilago trichophora]|uniref:Integrase catalytic domain-containing protein n=1 Tax=Ustilago trichophora TaxID=86804 RepID=A0A5C3DV79_9BASI|nr:uncharacterized protein UTRI_00416 [Ustilago trichophora]